MPSTKYFPYTRPLIPHTNPSKSVLFYFLILLMTLLSFLHDLPQEVTQPMKDSHSCQPRDAQTILSSEPSWFAGISEEGSRER